MIFHTSRENASSAAQAILKEYSEAGLGVWVANAFTFKEQQSAQVSPFRIRGSELTSVVDFTECRIRQTDFEKLNVEIDGRSELSGQRDQCDPECFEGARGARIRNRDHCMSRN